MDDEQGRAYLMCAAAQAAQKLRLPRVSRSRSCAAAQAAQKYVQELTGCVVQCAAAQAAQK